MSVACLYANLATLFSTTQARQKMGGTNRSATPTAQAIPRHPAKMPTTIPPSGPRTRLDGSWLLARVLELTYTAWGVAAVRTRLRLRRPAVPLGRGAGLLLRCELDAAFFHLYGINRDDAAYILDTFPIVRKKDEAAARRVPHPRVILEIYDRMAEATARASPTDPPRPTPGRPSCCASTDVKVPGR